MWVAISSITNLPLEEWFTMDVYYQQALYQSVVKVVEAQEKKSKEAADKIISKIDEGKETGPYVSPFNSVPKPTFQMG